MNMCCPNGFGASRQHMWLSELWRNEFTTNKKRGVLDIEHMNDCLVVKQCGLNTLRSLFEDDAMSIPNEMLKKAGQLHNEQGFRFVLKHKTVLLGPGQDKGQRRRQRGCSSKPLRRFSRLKGMQHNLAKKQACLGHELVISKPMQTCKCSRSSRD